MIRADMQRFAQAGVDLIISDYTALPVTAAGCAEVNEGQ